MVVIRPVAAARGARRTGFAGSRARARPRVAAHGRGWWGRARPPPTNLARGGNILALADQSLADDVLAHRLLADVALPLQAVRGQAASAAVDVVRGVDGLLGGAGEVVDLLHRRAVEHAVVLDVRPHHGAGRVAADED